MGREHSGSHRGFYDRVVVESISPTYYAGGGSPMEYALSGKGFDLIPLTAHGALSFNNDNPTENQEFLGDSYLYNIVSKTKTEMVLRRRVDVSIPNDNYLGVIVSADTMIAYWVNDTKPLP